MSIFTRGEQVKENINKKNVDLKTAYYRLKGTESPKVRILSQFDYVEYSSHSSFAHKVYTQPCPSVTGQECALCKAATSGLEGFDALKPRKRYVFVFADLLTKTLKALDVSKNQAKSLISTIEEYKDDLGELAFTLKRVGEGTSTTYTLSPVIKMKGDEPAQFEACSDLEVTDEYLNTILQARSLELQVGVLKEAGFPTDEYFPHVKLKDNNTETQDDPTANF